MTNLVVANAVRVLDGGEGIKRQNKFPKITLYKVVLGCTSGQDKRKRELVFPIAHREYVKELLGKETAEHNKANNNIHDSFYHCLRLTKDSP